MRVLFLFLFLTVFITESISQRRPNSSEIEFILNKINTIRSKGCKCGNKRMPAAPPLVWSETLFLSASAHARDMYISNFFGHDSPRNGELNERLGKVGYVWNYIAENIASGQRSLEQVYREWLRSPSHCRVLMSRRPRETALVYYQGYWVNHFGSQPTE